MTNPIIAEVKRGGITESHHRGSYVVSDANGRIVTTGGDIETPVFPRSAIKAFQCLPVIESGAADHFSFSDAEIALCCASHNGEPDHVRTAQSILTKIGYSEDNYECGAHAPSASAARDELVKSGELPRQVHNNCSGKHAGMLALSRQLGSDPHGYIDREHAVQQSIAKHMSEICGVNLSAAPVGIDGCSAPTWAFPLRNMALGFARLPGTAAGQRIIAAVRSNPFMVGGTRNFDTDLMRKLPRIFVKTGAEGVYCGCIAHAGLGFAIKCDDGASRGSELATAGLMLKLDCWTESERGTLQGFAHAELRNWNQMQVGWREAAIG